MTKISLSMLSAPINRRQVLAGLAGLLLVRFAGKDAIAAPQTFFIFFAKDSAEVSDTAKQIVAAVKGFIKPNTRASILGHADTSEKDPDQLSNARAKAVMSALLDILNATNPDGVILSASGKGTAEPRKPTGPNVAEPLNRYVSITIE